MANVLHEWVALPHRKISGGGKPPGTFAWGFGPPISLCPRPPLRLWFRLRLRLPSPPRLPRSLRPPGRFIRSSPVGANDPPPRPPARPPPRARAATATADDDDDDNDDDEAKTLPIFWRRMAKRARYTR
ncbi:hypothetical protein LQW54_006479 [Pestalotiopsis sp. IQ-011]